MSESLTAKEQRTLQGLATSRLHRTPGLARALGVVLNLGGMAFGLYGIWKGFAGYTAVYSVELDVVRAGLEQAMTALQIVCAGLCSMGLGLALLAQADLVPVLRKLGALPRQGESAPSVAPQA